MRALNLWRAFALTSWKAKAFRKDRRAVTSTEYALIAVIMVIAMLGGLSVIGGKLGSDFNQVSSEL